MYEKKQDRPKDRAIKKQAITMGLVDSNKKNEKYLRHLDRGRNFSIKDYNDGREWYKLYHSLDNVSDDKKNNLSFLKGFENGRLNSFREGIMWFNDIGDLDDIPDDFKYDPAFHEGYLYAESASNRIDNKMKK